MLKYAPVSQKANVNRQQAAFNRHFVSHSVASLQVSKPRNKYPVAVTLLVSVIVFRLRLKRRFGVYPERSRRGSRRTEGSIKLVPSAAEGIDSSTSLRLARNDGGWGHRCARNDDPANMCYKLIVMANRFNVKCRVCYAHHFTVSII